jgi:SAM-dependent methyltransferase
MTALEKIGAGPGPADAAASAAAAALPAPASVTHLHLLAALNSKLKALPGGSGPIRLCDMGCGDGALLAYLATCLPVLNPERSFEFYGVDVADSGVQAAGFFARTIARLDAAHPRIDWPGRLHLIASGDPWPFADGGIDIVISNQVLEHVVDHRHFLAETWRVLADGGLSLHLFPLIHYFWEGHIHMPLVHWVRQHHLIRRYIKLCSRLGMGSYRSHKRGYGMSLDQYAEEHADYMTFMTNYLSKRELLALCKAARLRADFSYTPQFYWARLRMMRRGRPRYAYRAPRPIWDGFLFFFLKRVSSITLFLEKRQVYAR